MVDWFYWFTMRQISFPIFLLVHYPVRAHGNQLMDSVKATFSNIVVNHELLQTYTRLYFRTRESDDFDTRLHEPTELP